MMTAITTGALLTELMRSFDGFIAIRKYVKVSSSETLQSESAFITASRYDRGQYMILLYLSCVLEADFVSLFTASKSLQTDPRIPYPDSRFIVRETGFSERDSMSPHPIHPFPFWIQGYGLGGSGLIDST